jgi:hypothetical protein
MAQSCNPSTWEETVGGLWFKASPGKKFTRPHFNQWLGEVAQAYHPSRGPGQPGYKARPSQKQPMQKKAGGVAQVIEHLPSKYEALSSTSSTAKKNAIYCSLYVDFVS